MSSGSISEDTFENLRQLRKQCIEQKKRFIEWGQEEKNGFVKGTLMNFAVTQSQLELLFFFTEYQLKAINIIDEVIQKLLQNNEDIDKVKEEWDSYKSKIVATLEPLRKAMEQSMEIEKRGRDADAYL